MANFAVEVLGDEPEPFKDPTLASVTGALMERVRDPELLVEDHWTKAQKDSYKKQFGFLVAEIDHRTDQAIARQGEAAKRAEAMSELPPVVREVAANIGQGLASLAGPALRVGEDIVQGEQDPHRDSLADFLVRKSDETTQALIEARKTNEVPDWVEELSGGVARSITMMLPLAATGGGAPAMFAGFGLAEGNERLTQGKDLGLTGDGLRNYVGRAALIEAGVGGVLSAVGVGAMESIVIGGGRGLARGPLVDVLKRLGLNMSIESLEEVATEVGHAYNEAYSLNETPPTPEEAREIAYKTIVQTVATMGVIHGYQGRQNQVARNKVADDIAVTRGWTQSQARGVVNRAAKRRGAWDTNIGEEIQAELGLQPDGLATWVEDDPDRARRLVDAGAGRTPWKNAGLPKGRSRQERARVVADAKVLLEAFDEALADEFVLVEEEGPAAVGVPVPLDAEAEPDVRGMDPSTEAPAGPFAPPAPDPPGGALVTPQPGPLESQEPAAPKKKPEPQPPEPEEAPAVEEEAPPKPKPVVKPKPAKPVPAEKKLTPEEGRVIAAAEELSPAAGFSAQRAIRDVVRLETFGLDVIDSPERVSWQESLDTAESTGLADPDKAMDTSAEILDGSRVLLSATETAGLVHHGNKLMNDHASTTALMAETKDEVKKGELGAELSGIRLRFDTLTLALERGGTEIGRALALYKMVIASDFSILSVKARARSAKGKALTGKDSSSLEALVVELQERADALEKKNDELNAELAEAAIEENVKATKRGRKMKKMTQATFDAKLAKVQALLKEGCRNG